MYLKNLTALGFKSFADKTTLNFVPGVAAIVGPNGCGKSNISDAIRWVLGEQSAKALRGGEMADVIFNGTDYRKPLGMAEVSLTIGDVDSEHLKAAGVEIEYNEVTVTRRVFRDGGSEYFINKTPCRLKDIQQLFMGTGMGRTSYSIMAQGNITQIISSKPEDRRTVFEEAAGITKFKAQKKESLRKLEHTDQNLLRVEDLIKEVKRQIGSLQRQAGKARRYKALQAELQHLDTQLARHQYDVLQTEIRSKTETVEKLAVELEVCSESVTRGETEVQTLRELLSELEQQISATQQQGQELKNQVERHESKIQFNLERLHELEAQNTKAVTDITQGEERQAAAREELEFVTGKLSAAQAELENNRAILNQRREALQGIERELMARQDTLRKAQSDLFAAAQQLSRVRNEINSLDLQKQGNVVRLEKLGAEKIQVEEEKSRLEARLEEFAANVEAEKLSVQASRGTVEERQKRLREIQGELAEAGQSLDMLLRQQAEKRSRLNVLEQLQNDYEGFSAGTLAVLKGAQGVIGTLTDKIRVSDEYIAAIETALGTNLQLVLSEQPDAAQMIINDLQQNKKGRASIAPLSFATDEISDVAAPSVEGLIFALGVVQGDESVTPLLGRLLGRTWIAPDLARATEAWQQSRGAFDFVTPKGETLSREGIYSGGTGNGNGKPGSSILARKNQIAELHAALAGLQESVNESSRRKGALQSEQTALQAGLQQAQNELRTQEVAIATRQGEFNALQNSLRGLTQKVQTVTFEIQRLVAQEEEGNGKRNLLAEQMGNLGERELSLQKEVSEHNALLDVLRQQRDSANATLTETKVALATSEQVTASFQQQQNALHNRVKELSHLLDQRKNEVSSFVVRRGQYEADIESSKSRIEGLAHEREQVNRMLAEFLGQKETQELEIISREESLKGQRRRLNEIQQQRASLDVDLAQRHMSVQNLTQRIHEKYQVNIGDIRSECITITIADEGPAKIETLTPDEMAARGLSTDWDSVAEQVSALQKRIEEMGAVNLVAIEEYEETEQRYQFLTSQYEDLVKAKEQLLDVINRINTQTREMFTETFVKIRDNFRALFTEIFGGGKADLVLTDEGDVLESGIEIVARPPGKQLQSISLLSGGEQTMTAVALLFSIYQVKPSPFCVLDELDAPLDESNINRFIMVLQRFLAHSQFVIITHNKRTIGMADVLYGVTMEEHGVSKIVSVKFHKADEESSNNLPPSAGSVSNTLDQQNELQVNNRSLEVVTAE
ncbi:MAG: chromosome segregation protein SMC [Verrucomicrobiota bacterium]|nr:chromosome segregation protein SMC [Verrucomicrobiota bacterium]